MPEFRRPPVSTPHSVEYANFEPPSSNPSAFHRSGRSTPREAALGRKWHQEHLFQASLRPERPVRRRSKSVDHVRMARTASEARRNAHLYGSGGLGVPISSAEKAVEDPDWRAGSKAYCDSHFFSTLREWKECRDVRLDTPDDWRVSSKDLSANTVNVGHDLTTNDAYGWKTASPIWTQEEFKRRLREYPEEDAVDIRDSEDPHAPVKDKKNVAGTDLGNIYRSSLQCNVLTPEMADKQFMHSLRNTYRIRPEEYQRKRRTNLNLPQFKTLDPEQLTKAKRLFISLDLEGSGQRLDPEDVRRFLTSLGHKPSDKAVKQLLTAAEEGHFDAKHQLKEFARLYHGITSESARKRAD